ncbi:MAG TPA: TraR/DksA family transcriptional regulator [Xanthomonadaceae bacterium]|nr:TraR/DksA family transcriptional regulator [Xanthomonadaceae bacterium]
MSDNGISALRARLLALRQDLLQSRQDAADEVKPVVLDQAAVGRVSRVDALQMQQMALHAARRRDERLALVDSALRRIDEGTYGLCVECEEAIDQRRLQVDPTALRCITCAERNTG